jgi:DNA-binding NarL/FixJ family response regulator
VARDDELLAIEQASAGVVLVGEAGIGKSRLLVEAVEWVPARRTVRVAATDSLSAVPFGAFASALARDVEPGAPFDAMTRTIQALAGDGPLDDVVIAVDDAHMLDDASAGLLLLVAQSGARVLATVRSREPCPEAVTRIWKDEFATRIEIHPLDEPRVGELLQSALGAPVDARTRRRLYDATRGNLLFLRELVRHGVATGEVTEHGGVWSWNPSAAIAPGVLDLVEDRLQHVTAAVSDVVEVLAVGEPLGRAVVELICSPSACAEAERDGVITSVVSGAREELRLVHPLYGQVVRARMTAGVRTTITGRVADALVAVGPRRRDDRLRIAVLQLEAGGHADPHRLGAAAREAGSRGDIGLAERLARAAAAADESAESLVLLGDVLYWAGRHDEIVERLGADLPPDATPEQVARAALALSSSLFFGLGRFEDADACLERGIQRAGPDYAPVLLGQRSQIYLFAGRGRESIEVGQAVIDDPTSNVEARLRAYAGLLCSRANCGQLRAVEAELPTAMGLVLQAGPDLAIYTTGGVMIAMFIVRMFSGGLDEVDALVKSLEADALQRPDDPFVGVWSFLLGRSAYAQGRLADALPRLRDAASVLRERDPGGVYPWTLGTLSAALGAADDRVGAQAVVDELELIRSPVMHHIDIDLDLGVAWAACAQGERSRAREIAEKLGRSLVDDGRIALGALALHDSMRLGTDPAEVVDALEAAAEECDGPVVAAFAHHARALMERDYDALLVAADEFAAAGWMLHAAECAAGASEVAGANGLRARQRDAVLRSAELARSCGPALTPMLESVAGKQALGTLTRREQEIALLASRGMSKREIADTLFLSVRTVGNHINHVYSKLGITSREELRVALHGLDTSGPEN